MVNRLRNRSKPIPQSFISANKIKPEVWRISEPVIIQTLKNQGFDIKKLKKIKYLRHQVCISYWNEKGGICSGFFSYRIFERWQHVVERLVYNCNSLYEIHRLNQAIAYEFTNYPYPVEIEAAINETIEGCTTQLTELASYKRNQYLVAS
ncbi:hypothetical protein [Brunnivagina elsteri]|uniref:hypothetical protein n=1 Tax=Brunnivagina elsteri TaxID=1247191 RepID=UPI001B803C4A|nr:hypothetical protein [Calothrix elsteri]